MCVLAAGMPGMTAPRLAASQRGAAATPATRRPGDGSAGGVNLLLLPVHREEGTKKGKSRISFPFRYLFLSYSFKNLYVRFLQFLCLFNFITELKVMKLSSGKAASGRTDHPPQ